MRYQAEIDSGAGGKIIYEARDDAEAWDRALAWAQGASYEDPHALFVLRVRKAGWDTRTEYVHLHATPHGMWRASDEDGGGLWDKCPACGCRGCPGADDSPTVRANEDGGELSTCECGEYVHHVLDGCDGVNVYDEETGRWVWPIHLRYDETAWRTEWACTMRLIEEE